MNANHARRNYLRALIGISSVLVLATLILRFGKALWLAPLNLTNENIVAAWFSGMLLFLASLHAADGYFRLRQTNLKAGLAWWVIAAMLMFMSADEIGSLHERIDDVVQMGAWLSFLPFLIVLLGACAWSFLQLWLTPSERRFVPGLILGFALLVSVGGQEFLEKSIKWPWYLVPFRSAFEEGSELTAMIILIYTMLPNSTGLFGGVRPAHGPTFSSVPMLRWVFVLVAAVIAWPVAGMSAMLDNQASVGHPSDWLACALVRVGGAAVDRAVVSVVGFRAIPRNGRRFDGRGFGDLCADRSDRRRQHLSADPLHDVLRSGVERPARAARPVHARSRRDSARSW